MAAAALGVIPVRGPWAFCCRKDKFPALIAKLDPDTAALLGPGVNVEGKRKFRVKFLPPRTLGTDLARKFATVTDAWPKAWIVKPQGPPTAARQRTGHRLGSSR